MTVYLRGTTRFARLALQSAEGDGAPSATDLFDSLPPGEFPLFKAGANREAPEELVARQFVVPATATATPAGIAHPNRDTYLESIEPGVNAGARSYLRLKSNDQGIILLGFNPAELPATADSGTLWLTPSPFSGTSSDFSYQASLFALESLWIEGSGFADSDPADGATYEFPQTGGSWGPLGFASALDSSTRIDLDFGGLRGDRPVHPFPVSGRILAGLRDGTYSGIAILERSTNTLRNIDFLSREEADPPLLYLYESTE